MAGIPAVHPTGVTPAPLATGIYPSAAAGLPPNNPSVTPSARFPAVSGSLLTTPALGGPGVGHRMGLPGSHVAVARASNVSQQAGLLPTPSLIMQVVPLLLLLLMLFVLYKH